MIPPCFLQSAQVNAYEKENDGNSMSHRKKKYHQTLNLQQLSYKSIIQVHTKINIVPILFLPPAKRFLADNLTANAIFDPVSEFTLLFLLIESQIRKQAR